MDFEMGIVVSIRRPRNVNQAFTRENNVSKLRNDYYLLEIIMYTRIISFRVSMVSYSCLLLYNFYFQLLLMLYPLIVLYLIDYPLCFMISYINYSKLNLAIGRGGSRIFI